MGAWNEDMVLSDDSPAIGSFLKNILIGDGPCYGNHRFIGTGANVILPGKEARSLRCVQKYYYLVTREGSEGMMKVGRKRSGWFPIRKNLRKRSAVTIII